MTISSDGALLATASAKGTLVRVFRLRDPSTGLPLAAGGAVPPWKTFRRGVTSSTIVSMRFNGAATLLCVGSDHGTVHVFALRPLPESPTGGVDGARSSVGGGGAAAESGTVAAAAASAASAAQSLFNGLMTTLPTSVSSERYCCAVAVEPGLAFTCGFVAAASEASGASGPGARAQRSVHLPFPGYDDMLVVVTSRGIVSLHRLDLAAGTTALDQQHFLTANEGQEVAASGGSGGNGKG